MSLFIWASPEIRSTQPGADVRNLREAEEFQGLRLSIERGVEPDERGMLPLRLVKDDD